MLATTVPTATDTAIDEYLKAKRPKFGPFGKPPGPAQYTIDTGSGGAVVPASPAASTPETDRITDHMRRFGGGFMSGVYGGSPAPIPAGVANAGAALVGGAAGMPPAAPFVDKYDDYRRSAAPAPPPTTSAPPTPPTLAPADAPSQMGFGPPTPGVELARDKMRAAAEFDDYMRNKYLGQKLKQGLTTPEEISGANAAAAWRHQVQAGQDAALPGARGEAASMEYQRYGGPRADADAVAGNARRLAVATGQANIAEQERTKRAAETLPLTSPAQEVAMMEARNRKQQLEQEYNSTQKDQPYVNVAQQLERDKQANIGPYTSSIQNIATGIGRLNGQYINSEMGSSNYKALQDAWQTFMALPNSIKPSAAREILARLQSSGIAAPAENSAGSTMLSRGVYSFGRAIPSILEGRSKAQADADTKSKDDSIKAIFSNLRYLAGLSQQ